MASNYFAKGLKRSALTVALGLCFVGGVQAQTNTAGAVSGNAAAGDTISITNSATGFNRTITVGADGNYRFAQLPSGQYQVSRNGGSPRTVNVNVGGSANVDFVRANGDTATLETVTVVGGGAINPIDVSSVESSTVLTSEQIDRLPVGRNTAAVALLAPGTVRSDSFGNVVSFGGASAAENAYYINGFNATNIRNGLAYNEVPFEGVAETQVKTGGYGAEFGRSLGGVTNVITKRGTNDWKFGASVYWAPDSLRAPAMNEERVNNNYTLIEGSDKVDNIVYNVYGGGPILKDRLFIFGLYQGNKTETDLYGLASNNATRGRHAETTGDNGLIKLDWSITDNHLLELTAFRDKQKQERQDYTLPARYSGPYGAPIGGLATFLTGGDTYVAKWTGYITDSLTLSALYGEGEYLNSQVPVNTDCPFVADNVAGTVRGCAVTANYAREDAGDTRKAARFDAEWVFGDHTIRGGLDREEITSIAQSVSSGGKTYTLDHVEDVQGDLEAAGFTVPAGTQFIVTTREFANGGEFKTKNSAWYLEDSWQITDNFMAYGGFRSESFTNLNADGVVFAEKKNTRAPRFGFSWDVNGDSTFKVFGNAGRYYIPIMANTNVRLSGAELDIQEYFVSNGTFGSDRFSLPNTGTKIARVVQSTGVAGNPLSVVDSKLSPLFQDEMILGFQHSLNDLWSVGVRGIKRKMSSGMDDYCAYQTPRDWAKANGYTSNALDEPDGVITSQADAIGEATSHCFLMNPGSDLNANIDTNGDGSLEAVTIPASALRIEKPRRTYQALEFFFERSWDKKWTMQGSYTFARSIGNTEGYVKSDIAQADAGLTQDFDFAELQENAYGYLPNDRRHALKVFGAYQLTDEWRIGANLLVQSGRPKNCFGNYAGTSPSPDPTLYPNSSFYCGGQPSPRGSRGRFEWSQKLGLQLAYDPQWADGLWMKVDVFNVLNQVNVTSRRERESPATRYGQPLTWDQQRNIRLSVGYDFSL